MTTTDSEKIAALKTGAQIMNAIAHPEIAAVLDIPLGTSKGWLFEARRELQRLLSGGDGAVLRRIK